MKNLNLLILIFLLLILPSPVYADDYQDGVDAYGKKDYKTAFEKLKPLAKQGNALAQYNLAGMYYYGRGVFQVYKEAIKWYRLSAEQGNASAQNNLGVMYQDGTGVIQDYIQAHKWFNISGANGEENGRRNRYIIEERMTPGQIAEAQRLAREWMEHK